MAKLLHFGILGFLQPTGKFWENCGIMKPFEMIRKGRGFPPWGRTKMTLVGGWNITRHRTCALLSGEKPHPPACAPGPRS